MDNPGVLFQDGHPDSLFDLELSLSLDVFHNVQPHSPPEPYGGNVGGRGMSQHALTVAASELVARKDHHDPQTSPFEPVSPCGGREEHGGWGPLSAPQAHRPASAVTAFSGNGYRALSPGLNRMKESFCVNGVL